MNNLIEVLSINEINDKLAAFEKELNSPQTPEFIKPRWILSHFPHMSRFDLRDWVRDGFIPTSLILKEGVHTIFTHTGANLAGHIWYFRENGHPLRVAAAIAEKFLKAERLF